MGIAVDVTAAAAVMTACEVSKTLSAAWVIAHGGRFIGLPVAALWLCCDGREQLLVQFGLNKAIAIGGRPAREAAYADGTDAGEVDEARARRRPRSRGREIDACVGAMLVGLSRRKLVWAQHGRDKERSVPAPPRRETRG